MKVLITGANRGLGFELARTFAQKGHIVIAGLRDKSKDEKLAGLGEKYPGRIVPVQMDITREDTVIEAAAVIEKSLGSVDAIINNAGILLGRDRKIEDLDMQEVEESFEVNTFGPLRVIRHFVQLLYKGENQCIINISSEAGSITTSWTQDYGYSMSKAALNMASQILSNYMKEKEIRVYALHPGWIRTDMGGPNAPGDPIDTANHIYDIVSGKLPVSQRFAFIDYTGKQLPF